MLGHDGSRPIRDRGLLDALEKVRQEPCDGTVWRSVREGRDPLACWRSGGRWDDGSFGVFEAVVIFNDLKRLAARALDVSARDLASRNLIGFCNQDTKIVEIVRKHGIVTFARGRR